ELEIGSYHHVDTIRRLAPNRTKNRTGGKISSLAPSWMGRRARSRSRPDGDVTLRRHTLGLARRQASWYGGRRCQGGPVIPPKTEGRASRRRSSTRRSTAIARFSPRPSTRRSETTSSTRSCSSPTHGSSSAARFLIHSAQL